MIQNTEPSIHTGEAGDIDVSKTENQIVLFGSVFGCFIIQSWIFSKNKGKKGGIKKKSPPLIIIRLNDTFVIKNDFAR